MTYRTDFFVFGRDGSLKVLVEVKGRTAMGSTWAARLRRNMHAHGQLPAAPYFLLAVPDRFYLWCDTGNMTGEIAPDYDGDPATLLGRVLGGAGSTPNDLTEAGLEIAVAAWLDAAVNGDESRSVADLPWLCTSGLLDAVCGGRVEFQELVLR